MTTTITVIAHCDEHTEVQIDVTGVQSFQRTIIQNKNTESFYVYGDKTVTIKEIPKTK